MAKNQYQIQKIKMPIITGFPNGHAWELRDLKNKKIIDAYKTKKQAIEAKKELLK